MRCQPRSTASSEPGTGRRPSSFSASSAREAAFCSTGSQAATSSKGDRPAPELGKPVQVSVARAAAADDGQMDAGLAHARSANRETALLTMDGKGYDLRLSIRGPR